VAGGAYGLLADLLHWTPWRATGKTPASTGMFFLLLPPAPSRTRSMPDYAVTGWKTVERGVRRHRAA